MDNDLYNNYGYLEIFGGIYLRKFPLLTKRVRGRIETFSMSGLAAPGALANRLQRRTARKANEANLDPPNQKSEITSL